MIQSLKNLLNDRFDIDEVGSGFRHELGQDESKRDPVSVLE